MTRIPDIFWRRTVTTTDGAFEVCYSANGLARIRFPRKAMRAGCTGNPPPEVRRWHDLTVEALRKALAGQAPGRLPPLDFSPGTPFQQKVWRALLSIKAGKTVSYGALARRIGKPGSSRAVGAACGANPLPVLVPCHRVVTFDSRLGGFSGGLDWKRKLLAREGLTVQ